MIPKLFDNVESKVFMMINLLQYYSKTEYRFCKQTSFCDVNTSSASSGLRKNVILANKLVSIPLTTFSLRPEEALLVLHHGSLSAYKIYILFCYNIGIS